MVLGKSTRSQVTFVTCLYFDFGTKTLIAASPESKVRTSEGRTPQGTSKQDPFADWIF